VPVTESRPAIDGRLDEPVWNDAARTGPLQIISGGLPQRGTDASSTEVFLLRDDDHLVIGLRCSGQLADGDEHTVGKFLRVRSSRSPKGLPADQALEAPDARVLGAASATGRLADADRATQLPGGLRLRAVHRQPRAAAVVLERWRGYRPERVLSWPGSDAGPVAARRGHVGRQDQVAVDRRPTGRPAGVRGPVPARDRAAVAGCVRAQRAGGEPSARRFGHAGDLQPGTVGRRDPSPPSRSGPHAAAGDRCWRAGRVEARGIEWPTVRRTAVTAASSARGRSSEFVDLLIDSNADRNSCYLIRITPDDGGKVVCSYNEHTPPWHDRTWQPQFEFAVAWESDGWTAELAFPFEIFCKNKTLAPRSVSTSGGCGACRDRKSIAGTAASITRRLGRPDGDSRPRPSAGARL
jgi:hypothetical protein